GLQDALVQRSNLVQYTQPQMLPILGIFLAWILLIPLRLAASNRQVGQRLPFDGAVPVPDTHRDVPVDSLRYLELPPVLQLNKSLPLGGKQHLLTCMVMPFR